MVDDDGDGRRLNGYTISSPCEPNGSGELTRMIEHVLKTNVLFTFFKIHFRLKAEVKPLIKTKKLLHETIAVFFFTEIKKHLNNC